eukprot:COSAG05_NODE_373_length_10684_cov_22.075012_8_plen_118_part_00
MLLWLWLCLVWWLWRSLWWNGWCDCATRYTLHIVPGEIMLAPATIEVVSRDGTLASLLDAIRARLGVEEAIALTMQLAVRAYVHAQRHAIVSTLFSWLSAHTPSYGSCATTTTMMMR